MRPSPKFLLLLPLLLSSGCALSGPRQWQTAQTPTKPVETAAHVRAPIPNPIPANQQVAAPEPKLYARDGTVVGETPPAAKPASQRTKHQLGEGDSSRSTILEWYQAALEERDSLQLEVHALHADMDKTRAALGHSDEQILQLQARVAALAADKEAQAKLNLELADRLTTAQIRRLQAEKLLLETKLQLSRASAQPLAAQTPEKNP